MIINHCCIWAKLNMVKMVTLQGALVLQQYQFTVKAIKWSENVATDFFELPCGNTWYFNVVCDSVFIWVVCI